MARALARRGHSVTVLCYGHGLGAADSEYKVVRSRNVPGYQNMRAGPDFIKPLLDLNLAKRLAKMTPDVIHVHNYEAPLIGVWAQRWHGIPMVYSAHNTMRDELHTYFRTRPVRSVAHLVGRFLDRSIPRMADHAIAISNDTVSFLKKMGCKEVSYIPPGVDLSEFPDVTPADLPPGPWVIYTGNPDQYQELDVLVEAMRQVPKARLLLVSAASLDDWKNKGLPGLLCETTNDFSRVRALMAAADIAALPRSVCRGFPIKLLNYLAMGLPTVAAIGSAPHMPGMMLTPNRNPQAMSRAIQELLDDPYQRKKLSKLGREYVAAHCTWQSRAWELERLYHRLVQ